MRSWLKPILAAGAAFALACTGLSDSELEVPTRGATTSEAEALTPSIVNIPLHMTFGALRQSVNDGLPTPIYSEKGSELAGRMEMDVTIKRDDDPRVSARGDAMIVEVPAKVKVKVYRRKRNGEKGSTLGTGSAKLQVRVSTTPKINDDWSMVGNTEITWRWVDSPTITVAGVEIELNDSLDSQINKAMDEAETDIDKTLLEESPLRETLAEVWTDMGTARQVKRNPPVWVRFAPEALFATDPEISGSGMEVTIGAQGVLQASLSQRMNDAEVGELADRQPPTSESGARLHVPIQLAWGSLKTTLAQQLEGSVFEGAGSSATITELVDLYPSGESVAVGLKVNIETPAGSTEVTAWATGRPDVNTAGEKITIADFQYDAATGQAAIDAAHDALKGQITEKVQSLLTVPLSDEIDGVHDTVSEVLSEMELAEGVTMSGTVDAVRIKDVRLTDNHLILDVSVACDLSLKVTAVTE